MSIRDNTETWLRNELAAHIKGIAAAAGQLNFNNPNDPTSLAIDELIKTGMGADLLNEPTVPMFVVPGLITVPLRDNTQTYGPWYSAGANGKTEVEVDEELVPWNFGSYNLLNTAANARVNEGSSQMQDAETGSVTFAGVPVINIGYLLVSGGPYVTDVQVNIGEGGATTTYSFSTWTKQFGTTGKEAIEEARKQRLLNNRNAQRNFFNNKKEIAKFQNNKQGNRQSSKRNKSRSSHPLIAANKQGDKYNTVIAPPYNVADKMTDLEDRYMASLDTIFTPFSTNFDGSGGTPHFERPSGNYPISSSGLNPYEYPHNFQLMTRADPDFDSDSLSITDSGRDDTLGYKAFALRSPLVMAGWGRDTSGKPVPAKEDDPNSFADDYKVNPSKWKAGPLDCRWDDTKKIWVASGGGPKKVKLLSNLNFRGSGLAAFYEFNTASGFHVSNNRDYVHDWLLPSGGFLTVKTKCWVQEDNGRYYVVNAACVPDYHTDEY
jgi:hypothetical protein